MKQFLISILFMIFSFTAIANEQPNPLVPIILCVAFNNFVKTDNPDSDYEVFNELEYQTAIVLKNTLVILDLYHDETFEFIMQIFLNAEQYYNSIKHDKDQVDITFEMCLETLKNFQSIAPATNI